jgi:hypothetical protein
LPHQSKMRLCSKRVLHFLVKLTDHLVEQLLKLGTWALALRGEMKEQNFQMSSHEFLRLGLVHSLRLKESHRGREGPCVIQRQFI